MKNDTIPDHLKSCTKKELADRFAVSYSTISRWCEQIGIITNGRILTPKHLRKFYEEYDMPE